MNVALNRTPVEDIRRRYGDRTGCWAVAVPFHADNLQRQPLMMIELFGTIDFDPKDNSQRERNRKR